MSDINKYFDLGIYNEEETNTHLDNLIKLNYIEIDINYYNFNRLTDIQKKRLYPFLNKKNDEYKKNSIHLIIDINSFKDKYLLNYNDMVYYQRKGVEILSDNDILNKYNIDPYNFTRFNDISELNNIDKVINISENNKYDNNYILEHKKIEKLGIYILPKDASPGFKNFRRIIQYLKNHFNIYLFLDNKEDDLDNDDKEFIKDVIEVNYLDNKTNDEVGDLIYNKKLTILLAIYGFYKRKDVILAKPAKIIISYQEPPVIYPISCYDYNLIDINLYNSLKKYAKLDENKFNFIKMDNFILPVPFYSNYNEIKRPVYDKNNIRVGLIAYAPKISHELVKLVNNIVEINKNIIITVYGYISIEWFKIIFPSEQIKLDQYDNTNPVKLQDNILFIDSINYNNHSTALEILKLKIPFIGYLNKNRYHGLFSESLIKTIKMEDHLLSDNINTYTKLVELYTHDEISYYNFYNKFIKKLDESKILSDEHYANNLAKTLNEFYADYYKNL
jgi:hypothetical protein